MGPFWWFLLGSALERGNQQDRARHAARRYGYREPVEEPPVAVRHHGPDIKVIPKPNVYDPRTKVGPQYLTAGLRVGTPECDAYINAADADVQIPWIYFEVVKWIKTLPHGLVDRDGIANRFNIDWVLAGLVIVTLKKKGLIFPRPDILGKTVIVNGRVTEQHPGYFYEVKK